MMKNKYKVMINSCWILLIIFFILKLFGADWFEPVINDTNFVKFCNFLDGGWYKYILPSILYTVSGYLIYLCTIKEKIGKDLWYIALLVPMSYIKANFSIVGMILEIVLIIVIPLIRCKFKNKLRVLLTFVLMLAFQVISLLTRTGYVYLNPNNTLVTVVLSIDYNIMIALYYLYLNYERKEK